VQSYITKLKTLQSGTFKCDCTVATPRKMETLYQPLEINNINPLNVELNPIYHLLALLGVHFLHVSRIRVKSLILRLLMSYIYIYMEHLFLTFLDHTRRTTVGRTPLDE